MTENDTRSTMGTATLLCLAVGAAASTLTGYLLYRHCKQLQQQLNHEKKNRADERAGRIAIEKQLRKLQQQNLIAEASTSNETDSSQGNKPPLNDLTEPKETSADFMQNIVMKPIGYLSSVYNGRNGTPRQGMFVPSGRAVLKLEPRCNPRDSLDGLQEFGHVWLIFVFHENTNFAKHQQLLMTESSNTKNNISVTKSKIKPPRLGDRKVGLYATRSPHRHNNIGLTLARVDKIDSNGTLYLSAMDLCDGTPILDIKPVIEYDCVHDLKVPDWIKDPIDSIKTFQVKFMEESVEQLSQIMTRKKLKLFQPNEKNEILLFIEQVLRYDMRSHHKKSTKVGQSDEHTVHLDHLLISFTIENDIVSVQRIEYKDI